MFHGNRGDLHQHYREGQEDQLSALGLVVNMIVYWNTIYMNAALDLLRSEGHPVRVQKTKRVCQILFGHDHINRFGQYSFVVLDEVMRGELRLLENCHDKVENAPTSLRHAFLLSRFSVPLLPEPH